MTPGTDRTGGSGTAPLACAALIGAGVASTVVLVTLPLFVGGIVAEHGFGEEARGWIAAADMAGSALASLAVLRRMDRLPWRGAALAALAVAIAANLASIAADSLWSLMAVRLTCGAGCGVVLSIAFTGLCHTRNPERSFAFYVLAQLVLQALLLALLPGLIAGGGMRAVYLAFAACLTVAALLTQAFPRGMDPAAAAPAGAADAVPGLARVQGPARIALGGQATYFLAMAALWAFYEGIGSASDLDLAAIGKALAASALAGIGGAAAAVVVGARVKPAPALAAGTALSVAAALLLAGGTTEPRFALSACLFNFAWNFAFPYQMGVLSRLDRDGAVAVTSLVVQLGGLAAGPALAALAIAGAGYDALLAGCALGFAAGLALLLRGARG